MNNSVIIGCFLRIFYLLNIWYEHSGTYKIFTSLKNIALKSFIFGNISKSFIKEYHNNYSSGSFFINFIFWIVNIFINIAKSIFLFFSKLNDKSYNKKIISSIFAPFLNYQTSTINNIIRKSILGRLSLWLFFNDTTPSIVYAPTKNHSLVPFLIYVLFFAALTLFVPWHYATILFFAIAAVVFSYINIKLSFCFFIVGFSVVPHHLWSNTLIMLAAVFYWAIFAIQYFLGLRKGVDLKYIAPSIILYVFFCVISFFTGFGGMDSVRVAAIVFSAIAIGILIINIFNTKKDLHLLIVFIFISLVLTSLYGLLQHHLGIEIREDFVDMWANIGLPGRLYSTMGNPNNFAKFLIMLLPFCAAFMLTIQNQLKKILLLGLIGIVFLALMLTFSRASYLALAGAFAVMLIILKPRIVPIAILATIVAIPFVPDVIIMRIMTIGTDSSSLYRILIWEGSFRTLINYWASGIGIGPAAFTSIYRAHAASAAGNAMHAHNVFFNVWIEVGLGGFIAIVLYNFKTLKSSVSTFFSTTDIDIKYYLAASIAALVAFLMFSVVEHVWFYPRTMLTYFIMLGIIWAIIKIDATKEFN